MMQKSTDLLKIIKNTYLGLIVNSLLKMSYIVFTTTLKLVGVFPGGSVIKNLAVIQETRVNSLGGKIPQRRKWQPTPEFLPGKSYGQRNLEGYSLWGHKSWTQLSN